MGFQMSRSAQSVRAKEGKILVLRSMAEHLFALTHLLPRRKESRWTGYVCFILPTFTHQVCQSLEDEGIQVERGQELTLTVTKTKT